MSQGMNKVYLLGNLGADPELKFFPRGEPYLRLRLATDEPFKGDDDQWQTRPEWHSVILVGKRAEPLSRILQQGDRILVEGRVTTRAVAREDGTTRYFTDVRARDIHLAGRPMRESRRPRTSSHQVEAVAAAS